MSFALTALFAALTSAEAVVTVLNTAASTGPRKFAEAKELLAREAKAGLPLQQFVTGLTTSDKDLSKKYLDAARPRILAMAEKKNNSMAWYLLSMENNDLGMLRKAADGGNVQALNALGAIDTQEALNNKRLSSNEVERVLHRSFGYFGQAAALRDANGFINLGTCYLRGLGCEQDMELAFACFKSAAELGHPEGMDYMSAAYEHGHGVRKDAERSLYWKMRGRAARGDEAADRWLRERK